MFVAAIGSHVRQTSWILKTLLQSKLFVTYLSWFITLKFIYLGVHTVNLCQIEADLWKLPILDLKFSVVHMLK